MFSKRTGFIWVGILRLSGMFLMGQQSDRYCSCTDNDGDGYGDRPCDSCTYPNFDCDDNNPDVHPGVIEGPIGDPTCSDGLNNDCLGYADMDDVACTGGECFEIDGDGYFGNTCPGGTDCNDDPSDDAPVCDTCSCGDCECAGCAFCMHRGSYECAGDEFDTNCNGQPN